jgi:hypothetical protein
VVLKLGHYRKQIGNACEVLKCGAEKGRKESVVPIVREMRKYYEKSKSRGIFCMQ